MDDTVDRARIAPAYPPPGQVAPPPPQRPVKPPRGRGLLRWLIVLIVAIACIFAWEQFQKRETSGEQAHHAPPAQTIRDAAIAAGDVPILDNALGAVTPLATVTVRTQVNGQLQKIGFTEGQMVKAGDFLAQVDPRPYEATLAQNQAQFEKDTALSNQAQADLKRYETLSKQDSIALQQVQDQQFLVKQDKAAMDADQAQIDTAKLNIAYAHIVAPVSGRVGLRQVDVGNYLQTTDATGVVIITELQPISVIFSIPEDQLPPIMARLKTGAKLEATAFDRANVKKLAVGALTSVDNQIDPTTGTVKMRATFDNKDGALFPQQFVNIQLLVDTMTNAVIAPNAAIQQGPDGGFVYVVNANDTVSVRNVKTGPVVGQQTAVLSGLKVGEQVVIDGADRLKEGAKVQVRNGPPAAAAGAKPAGANASQSGAGQSGVDQGQPQPARHHRKQGAAGQGGAGQSP